MSPAHVTSPWIRQEMNTTMTTYLWENETLMALLAIFLSSMHSLRWGCWRVFMVRAVVQDI